MSQIGHNAVNAGPLKAFVQRLEKLGEEKAKIGEDIGSVYAEAKSAGYDPKILRQVIRERAKDRQKRAEQMDLFDTYWAAVGE